MIVQSAHYRACDGFKSITLKGCIFIDSNGVEILRYFRQSFLALHRYIRSYAWKKGGSQTYYKSKHNLYFDQEVVLRLIRLSDGIILR
jgi:hypothetical protein